LEHDKIRRFEIEKIINHLYFMKIALLKAGVDPRKCLNGFKYKEFSLSLKESVHPHNLKSLKTEGLIDYDLFIADIKELNFMDSIVLEIQSKNIHDAIKNGAVLLCFAGAIEIFNKSSDFSNYSWFPKETQIDSGLIENSSANIILTKGSFPFINFFEKNKLKFSSECFIKPRFGDIFYNTILADKGNRAVGLYQQEHRGHIFILPRVKDKEEFIESFTSNVLPTLPLVFQIESPSPFKTPEYAIKYLGKIPGIKEIKEEIKILDAEIVESKEKRREKEEGETELKKWIGLIWLKHIPLQRVVGDAFETLGLKVERPPETQHGPDLRLKYKGKEVIVEIEGSKNAIAIKKGRELYDWLGNEDPKVKGVLVGNPFNELPIEKRSLHKNKSFFTKELQKLAESRGFSLMLSTDLFSLVCKKLKKQEIDSQKLMDKIYEGKGIIRPSS